MRMKRVRQIKMLYVEMKLQ